MSVFAPPPTRLDTGCLIWNGYVDENGYGKRGGEWAHRWAWRRANLEDIPEGHEIDHLCKVLRCIEPMHLECITAEEHHRRTHPRAAECGQCGGTNWRDRRDGGRVCVDCQNRRNAEWRERRRVGPVPVG